MYQLFPLLCLLQTKFLVRAQDMYHSYHTYDFYSQSDENDFSHSTTEKPIEFYDFLEEAKNGTELLYKLKHITQDYFMLESCIENIDRSFYTLDDPYHMKPSDIGFNAHMDAPDVVAHLFVLCMDHLMYPNTSKTEYPCSYQNLKVLDIGSGTGYVSTIFGHLVGHSGESLAYIDRLPNGTYLREKSGYPIDKPLGGLISLKEQMDEYKVQLQGKYTKRYRIDKPEDNIWHALGLNRKAETIDAFSISPVMPPNYTGYTHKLRDKFDSAFLREGYERSDFIPHPK
ncbi:hypothetical protein M8J76_002086 [Diaphorina citri]|nr:hypothetical protein M8J76_002086 [Diaphorina citri]